MAWQIKLAGTYFVNLFPTGPFLKIRQSQTGVTVKNNYKTTFRLAMNLYHCWFLFSALHTRKNVLVLKNIQIVVQINQMQMLMIDRKLEESD
jgi:hypothetical protein